MVFGGGVEVGLGGVWCLPVVFGGGVEVGLGGWCLPVSLNTRVRLGSYKCYGMTGHGHHFAPAVDVKRSFPS